MEKSNTFIIEKTNKDKARYVFYSVFYMFLFVVFVILAFVFGIEKKFPIIFPIFFGAVMGVLFGILGIESLFLAVRHYKTPQKICEIQDDKIVVDYKNLQINFCDIEKIYAKPSYDKFFIKLLNIKSLFRSFGTVVIVLKNGKKIKLPNVENVEKSASKINQNLQYVKHQKID